jgi:hypothetical protein
MGSRLLSVDFWLAALVLGSLAFFNTWDFPIYLALYAAAVILAQYNRSGMQWELAYRFFGVIVVLGAGRRDFIPAVLPGLFITGRRDAAQPGLLYTRGASVGDVYAPLLLPVFAWLVLRWRQSGSQLVLARSALFSVGLVAALVAAFNSRGVVLLQANPGLAGIWGASDISALIRASIFWNESHLHGAG